MDLGATVCLARIPRCGACPLAATARRAAGATSAAQAVPLRGLVPAAARRTLRLVAAAAQPFGRRRRGRSLARDGLVRRRRQRALCPSRPHDRRTPTRRPARPAGTARARPYLEKVRLHASKVTDRDIDQLRRSASARTRSSSTRCRPRSPPASSVSTPDCRCSREACVCRRGRGRAPAGRPEDDQLPARAVRPAVLGGAGRRHARTLRVERGRAGALRSVRLVAEPMPVLNERPRRGRVVRPRAGRWEAVERDWRTAPVDERLRATLGFLEKLTLRPAS